MDGNTKGCPRGHKPLETLEERYADDPVLLRFYKKKLRRRGWAGKRDATERDYQRRRPMLPKPVGSNV